jgi:hypothetical protein
LTDIPIDGDVTDQRYTVEGPAWRHLSLRCYGHQVVVNIDFLLSFDSLFLSIIFATRSPSCRQGA